MSDKSTTTPPVRSVGQKLEPYISFIGPMAMILAILLFMAIAEPTRYFRASNLNQILLDAALYMPMAMAMTPLRKSLRAESSEAISSSSTSADKF